MCERFYFPYARKLWGLDPASWPASRPAAGSRPAPRRLLARVAAAGGQRPWFWYPGRLRGHLRERPARPRGRAELRYRTAAERVELGPEGATVTLAGGERWRPAVWSTIPLPTLAG